MDKVLRILVVEDVPADAELEMRELKRAGLRVTHRLVETEEAFRSALKEFQPEIILSDFSMPHFDGMAALALVRELAPDVPFIFVSGTIGEEYAIRALKNGATDYVLKNNLVRLPSAVERALQEQAERAARRKTERELEETRNRLDSIVASLSDVVWSFSLRENRLLYVSPAVRNMYRQPVNAFYATPTAWLDAVHPEDRDRVVREWNDSVATRYFDSTYRIVLPDGEVLWIHSRGNVISDERNEPLRIDGLARDVTQLKQQEQRIARLNRIHAVLSGINSAIVRIRDRGELFKEACRIAVEHGGFGMAWIGRYNPQELQIEPVASAGLEGNSSLMTAKLVLRGNVPQSRGMISQMIKECRPVFCNDITKEPEIGGERRAEAIRRGYRSVIALPLLVEGSVVGSMSLFAKESDFFDDEEMKLLNELAGDISFALDHIAKEEKLEKLSRIRAISGEINAAIVRIREREALLRETCRIAAEHGKFEFVWVALLDEEKKKVNPVAWTGFSPEAANAVTWETISPQGTLGEAIQTRKLSVRNDIEAELPTGKLRQEALKKGCLSTVCLPLVADDNVVALITLYATGRGFFDEDELALLNEVAADVSFALQAISRQEKLEYLSYYDALTGLPNRQLFVDRLSQQMRARSGDPRMVALILLNIERLRIINETLGRHGGDELLRLVARRLEHAFHGTDYIARIGADGFGVVIRGIRDTAEIAHAVESQVLACFRDPFAVNDKELRVAAKTGIAMFPADGGDADTLFKNAEAALRKAKDTGERFLFYTAEMNAQAAQSLSLESRLRKAVEAQQFVLHYQPKVELASGRVCGLEALIRWNDPETGLVPPMQFIPLLEETGMILEVGRWAIRKALEDYREWCARGLQPPRIAVNVSTIQLRQKNFVDVVRDAISGSPAGSHGLDLEITESLIMVDIEGNIEKLRAVRDMGVNIAIDDFGTGYSSLGYLAKLPVNAIKIDRSFIITMANNADSMTIVSTIISLAHSLNLKVIAEGVDSEEQRNLLKLLKCDEMQGYLFSKPLPAAEVEAKFLHAGAAA